MPCCIILCCVIPGCMIPRLVVGLGVGLLVELVVGLGVGDELGLLVGLLVGASWKLEEGSPGGARRGRGGLREGPGLICGKGSGVRQPSGCSWSRALLLPKPVIRLG